MKHCLVCILVLPLKVKTQVFEISTSDFALDEKYVYRTYLLAVTVIGIGERC